jgi:fatty acid-binding protein DegV
LVQTSPHGAVILAVKSGHRIDHYLGFMGSSCRIEIYVRSAGEDGKISFLQKRRHVIDFFSKIAKKLRVIVRNKGRSEISSEIRNAIELSRENYCA